jgi:membrane protein DedA with SNARE-associated domain/pimeloyl-ACP methyl ester carboxylesterase
MSEPLNSELRMPSWYWFIAFYLLSLIMSWSMIAFLDSQDYLHKHQNLIHVEKVDSHFPLSYYHFPAQDTSRPPVLLLHDHHFKAEALIPLAEIIHQAGYEVLIPEYSGYGKTSYPHGFSLEEKAEIVSDLLRYKNINDSHFIGHGLGGAIAFYLSDQADLNIHSLILLSAMASPDVYLLGNHTLNRALYALQFPLYYGVHLLIPHFGWIDELPVDRSSIRTNYNIDLRPVRENIADFESPVKIIHGKYDRYVNIITAEEHHRLLPQSELLILESDQYLITGKAQNVADQIVSFFSETEIMNTVTRSEASPERIAQSEEPFNQEQVSALTGFALLLILTLLVFATFVSEDLACIGAGLLAAKGILNFIPAVLACFTGILITDITIYWLGRWLGSPVLNRAPFRWVLEEEDVNQAEQTFREQGIAIIFLSRFIPGTRFPVYFTAGMVRAKFSLFLVYFIMAILIWTPILVGTSYFIGQSILDYFHLYQDYAIWIIIFIVLILVTIFKIVIPALTTTGRRRLKVKAEKFRRRFS